MTQVREARFLDCWPNSPLKKPGYAAIAIAQSNGGT